MDDFQVEIACTLIEDGTARRDVDLLERFGVELEAVAGALGPATALEGDSYVAMFTVPASSMIEAGRIGIDAYNTAMERALESFGDKLGTKLVLTTPGRLHVDQPEPVLA